MKNKLTIITLALVAALISIAAFGFSKVFAETAPQPVAGGIASHEGSTPDDAPFGLLPQGDKVTMNLGHNPGDSGALKKKIQDRQPTPPVSGLEPGQQASLRISPGTDSPAFISGTIIPPAGADTFEKSKKFFQKNKKLFRMSDPDSELELKRNTRDVLGMSHVHMAQKYKNVPVFAGEISVHFSRDGKIVAVNSSYVPEISLSTMPALSVDDALKAARDDLGHAAPSSTREMPLLMIFSGEGQAPVLTWKVTLASDDVPLRMAYFVDAQSGEIVQKIDMIQTARNRLTYSAGNNTTLPGTLLISEGGTSSDAVVLAAHENAGLTYDYFKNTFGLDSFDGAGATLISTAHFGNWYNNAFWNGYQMVYGDGDGYNFGPFSQATDVVAHELTHAVTQYSAGLVYLLQSGALNESYSDVFGVMVDRNDWLIGEDIYTPGVSGDALRSLSDPALYDQPAHMSDFIQTFEDNGGVHTNSGIPNKAAYNVAAAIGKEKMEQIWYRTLTFYLNSGSQFLDVRDASVQAAVDLYGAGSAEAVATADGFEAVGLGSDQHGAISGTLRNEAGAPIENIYVIAYQSDGLGQWLPATNASSDASGNYALRGLAGGDYKLEFYDFNGVYLSEFFDDRPDINAADAIAVAPDAVVTGRNAVLGLAGSISGTVTDEAGAPVGEVAIFACNMESEGWCYPITYTDSDGTYVAHNLAPGNYRVMFWDLNSVFAYQYYENRAEWSEADPVSVNAGSTTGDIDARLLRAGSISGTVNDENGQPLDNINVRAWRSDGSNWGLCCTDSQGNYTIDGLTAGSFTVEFGEYSEYMIQWYDGKTDMESADRIEVGYGQDISGIGAHLQRGASISGVVTNEAALPLMNILVNIYRENSSGNWEYVDSTWTWSDGHYIAGGLTNGRYRIEFYDLYEIYDVEYYDNKPDFDSADAILVSIGNPVEGKDAVLSIKPEARDYYWTWYDSTATMKSWVLMANPAASGKDMKFDISIEGWPLSLAQFGFAGYAPGVVPEGKTMAPKFDGYMGGPLKVSSRTGDKAIVSQRSLMGSSFEEVLGTEAEKLSDHFWWTWYDQSSPGFTNWILVANPSDSETVHAVISFKNLDGKTTVAGADIAPGKNWNATFPGKMGGPVELKAYLSGNGRSWPQDARDVIASQRVLSSGGTAFNEVPGIPAEELSNSYLWTWYDQLSDGFRNWILVANPNESNVTYQIKINGEEKACDALGNTSCVLGAHEWVSPEFPGVMNGPVELTASNDVIASQRVVAGPSFEEVPGYPVSFLADDYHWTWYDQVSAGSRNWVLIANNTDAPLTYSVRIAGNVMQTSPGNPGTIAPHSKVTPEFPGLMSGPVEVTASGPVMVSQRVFWNGYFNEVLGTVLE